MKKKSPSLLVAPSLSFSTLALQMHYKWDVLLSRLIAHTHALTQP